MIRLVVVLSFLAFVPAHAEQPPRPPAPACAAFASDHAAFLTRGMATALVENDALTARVAALSAELAALKKPPADVPAPP